MSDEFEYPTFLSRTISTIHTSQESEGTCWAHSIANLVSRYLRNIYDKNLILSSNEELSLSDEKCKLLFYTVQCKDFFKCLLENECNNQTIINSALLFRLLYNILIKINRFNFCGINIFHLRCIKKLMEYLKTISHLDIMKKLKFHKLTEKYKEEMEDNINVIFDIINFTKYVEPSYYTCSKGKILDVENLKIILEHGFYAFFFVLGNLTRSGHAMIISGYNPTTDMYRVKNSWGDINHFDLHGFNMSNHEAPSSMFYDENNRLIVGGLYYIFPSIKKKNA
jgi:hypothetical protein